MRTGNGVIHRDIKPSNVMLTRKRVVKIADFGLAKILQESKNEGSQRASGTPLYMAPEQILGKPVDYRTDLYAFGGSVFHLLAGEPPFVEGEILYHHVHTKPRRLKTLRPDVPPALESIVMRCLKKDSQRAIPDTRAGPKSPSYCEAYSIGFVHHFLSVGSARGRSKGV